MKQYVDNSPLNAGILVDYSKRKRKVWFSYPEKPKGWIHNTFKVIYPLFLFIYFLSLAFISCFWFLVLIVYMVLYVVFFPSPVAASQAGLTTEQFYGIIKALLFWVFIFLPPLFPALWVGYHYKRFKTVIPKLNFYVAMLFEKTRRVKVKQLDSLVYELPYFHNVRLKYDLEKDFAKKLVSINVKPLRENYFKVFKGKEKKLEGKYWKAVFKFSSIPKDGCLIIDFI